MAIDIERDLQMARKRSFNVEDDLLEARKRSFPKPKQEIPTPAIEPQVASYTPKVEPQFVLPQRGGSPGEILRGRKMPTWKEQADVFKRNYELGRLSQEESKAYSRHLKEGTPESKLTAEKASESLRRFSEQYPEQEGGLITKDVAQYLPQFKEQLGAQIAGGLAGGTTALVAGQLGPQVALPEELITVPTGIKIGAVAATGKQAYDVIRGSAYKGLLDLGISDETARKMAKDEALISAAIEMADTGIDIATLGLGNVLEMAGKGGIKQVVEKFAKKGSKKAAETGIRKLLSLVGRYGINVAGEAGEEMAQEAVSIATEKRAAKQEGIERPVQDDLGRIVESGKGGARLAAVLGAGTIAGTELIGRRPSISQKIDVEADIKRATEIAPKQAIDVESDVKQAKTLDTTNQPPTKVVITNNDIANVEKIPASTVETPQTKYTSETISTAKELNVPIQNTNRVAKLANVLKTPVLFDAKTVNGYYENGKIHINPQSKTPVMDTFFHELTHHIENSGEKYTAFQNKILDSDVFLKSLEEQGLTLPEYSQSIKSLYAESGIELDNNAVNQEMVSKFVESNLFQNEKSIQRLAQTNRGIIQTIKNWIDDMVVKFKGTPEQKALLEMQKMYKKALSSVGKVKEAAIKYEIPPKEQYTADGKQVASQKTSINDKPQEPQVAQVLTHTEPKKETLKERVSLATDEFKRNFIDDGDEIAKLGEKVKDPVLYQLFNNAKQARQSAEMMIGDGQYNIDGSEKVGRSLTAIFQPVIEKGTEYHQAFSDYLMHVHNIDRMSLNERYDIDNKPVFGETITADTSREKASELLKSHPEFDSLAKSVYVYNRNLMQWRVDGGLISKEAADSLNEMYPHYVPTFRKITGTKGVGTTDGTATIATTVKKAKGGSEDILPIHESMARQTVQTVRAAKSNILGSRMLSLAENKEAGDFVQEITESEPYDIDEEMPELKNTFRVFKDGKAYSMKVNGGLFQGVKAISGVPSQAPKLKSMMQKVTSVRKKLLTEWNPMFTVRNVARDLQAAGLYSKDFKLWAKNYPNAIKQIVNNSKQWQQYQAMGGFGSSFFDYEQGYDPNIFKEKNVFSKSMSAIADKISDLNYTTEQATRFAEYLATIEKKGNAFENQLEAMYNAADITVNFGRGGTVAKDLNSTFVPFFNPAIQGANKFYREFAQPLAKATGDAYRSKDATKFFKSLKASQWVSIVMKASILGIVPGVVNALINGDDEEYKQLTQHVKDNYWVFKIDEDRFFKIPKGRELSVFTNLGERAIRAMNGEEKVMEGYIEGVKTAVFPESPIESNIFSPIREAAKGVSWYGSDIEPQRLKVLPAGERYDERTDFFSKWIGGKLNISPKRINYVLDSYSGVIGDFLLPIMTPRAEQNPVVSNFIVDSVISNNASQRFYSKMDEITELKNSEKTKNTIPYEIESSFLNKQSKVVSDINKEIRNIELSKMSDKEKKQKIRELKAISNGIQINALRSAQLVENTARKYYGKDFKDVKFKVYSEVFGHQYAIEDKNKDLGKKSASAKTVGISSENWWDIYSKADYDGNKSISSKEAKNVVKKSRLNQGQKVFMYNQLVPQKSKNKSSLSRREFDEAMYYLAGEGTKKAEREDALIDNGFSEEDAYKFLAEQYGYKY